MRHSLGALVLVVLIVIGGHAVSEAGASPPTDEFAALDRLAAATNPVGLTFKETPVARVLEAVRKTTGVEIELKSLPDRNVTIETGKVSLKEALVQLAKAAGLAYEVVGPNKLVVRRNTNANANAS